jgi:hypothetical protein
MLVVGVAAGAGAAYTPAADALLGGGSVGAQRTTDHLDVKFTTIRIQKDGKSLHFYGDWIARCDGNLLVTANFDQIVPIAADGSFSGTGPLNSEIADGTFEFNGKLSRIVLGGRSVEAARGTGRVNFSFHPDPAQPHACDTTVVNWQARTSPTASGKATPRKGGSYYGNTSATFPVVMRVSSNGKQVVQTGLEFVLKCAKREQPSLEADITPTMAIGRNGSFVNVERYEERIRAAQIWGEGSVMKYTAVFRGKFGAWAVRGSLKVDATVVASDGTTLDTCSSGPLSFAASL